MRKFSILLALGLLCNLLIAKEYHVSKKGNDQNPGSPEQPFLTIQAAAKVVQAGDVITVHEGVYSERVDPPRGGSNDLNRITFQAAEGEKVLIKGSEFLRDWFSPQGIPHHTGEVYMNGKSLFEQNSLEGVKDPKVHEKAVDPSASLFTWYSEVGEEYTTFWANFQELDPNREEVEINVREACFYPSRPGVNHGPYLVDNNLFLTSEGLSIQDASEGGAYVHNLFAGRTKTFNVAMRVTPYHHSHSTRVVALRNIVGGDNRFFNNIYIRTSEKPDEALTDRAHQNIRVGYGLNGYDDLQYSSLATGNVFYNGAKPYKDEFNSIQTQDYRPQLELEERGDAVYLNLDFDAAVNQVQTQMVTTRLLGATIVSEALFECRDGQPYCISTDYFEKSRDADRPVVGPFESLREGSFELKIW